MGVHLHPLTPLKSATDHGSQLHATTGFPLLPLITTITTYYGLLATLTTHCTNYGVACETTPRQWPVIFNDPNVAAFIDHAVPLSTYDQSEFTSLRTTFEPTSVHCEERRTNRSDEHKLTPPRDGIHPLV